MCSLGSSPACIVRLQVHPGATTFPPVCAFWCWPRAFTRAHPLASQTPIQCPRSRTATPEVAQFFESLRGPDCALSRLLASVADEYDRPVTQSIATPVARLPWSPPKIGPKFTQALSVSPHPGADGLVQGELPPITPEYWPLSPASPLILAHPLQPPSTAGLGRNRWGLSSPYHVAEPRRLHGTTEGR